MLIGRGRGYFFLILLREEAKITHSRLVLSCLATAYSIEKLFFCNNGVSFRDLCFQKLLKFQQLLKTRLILILNFTRPHAITYTNKKKVKSCLILSAIMNGIDLDIEGGDYKYYPEFITELRMLMDNDPQRSYLITGAPQCPFPDHHLGPQNPGTGKK